MNVFLNQNNLIDLEITYLLIVICNCTELFIISKIIELSILTLKNHVKLFIILRMTIVNVFSTLFEFRDIHLLVVAKEHLPQTSMNYE